MAAFDHIAYAVEELQTSKEDVEVFKSFPARVGQCPHLDVSRIAETWKIPDLILETIGTAETLERLKPFPERLERAVNRCDA